MNHATSKFSKAVLLGIGGAGMTALAQLLTEQGVTVVGYDCAHSDQTKRLEEQGIPIRYDREEQSMADADFCVYSAALSREDPLLQYAQKHMPVFSRGEMTGRISRDFQRVAAVAGTHGKTTVSALLTYILMLDGKDPSALIGGYLPAMGGNGRMGARCLLVCEACEFAGSFLHLKRDVGVLLNIDNDHLDCYGSMEGLAGAFQTFTDACGTCLVNGEDPLAMKITGQHPHRVTFGKGRTWDYGAEDIVHRQGFFAFTFYCQGKALGRMQLKIPGEHNVYNGVAAAGAAHLLGASLPAIRKGLETFTGVARRFEILYRDGTLTVADDYAHHPAEIASVLAGAKAMGFSRITAVFQPFTFSRTKALAKEFADALSPADRVILAPVMGGREPDDGSVSSLDIARHLRNAVVCGDLSACAETALSARRPGELIVTMGCGNVYLCAREMIAQLPSDG